MPALRNISKCVVAALSFFTRLPFWRLVVVERHDYERVVPLWPLAGWVTGGTMAFVFWSATQFGCPVTVSIVLALASRVLMTGALHEDGMADFCDGFGGGTDRDSILRIMKDSHIGTYGVLGLLLYYLLLWNVLTALMQRGTSPLVFLLVDSLCKYLASTIIYFLPYARRESESKNRYAYSAVPAAERVLSLLLGMFPLVLCVAVGWSSLPRWESWMSGLSACGVLLFVLYRTMYRRIGGYTGDCCGATMLLAELVFYLILLIVP